MVLVSHPPTTLLGGWGGAVWGGVQHFKGTFLAYRRKAGGFIHPRRGSKPAGTLTAGPEQPAPPQVRCSGCPSSVPGQQPLAIQGDGWRLAGAAVAGMPWPPPGTAAAGGRPGGNSVSTTPRRLPAAPPTQLVGAGLGCVPLHLQSIV